MDAAVVELDALADPVGPASENHNLSALRGGCLALHLVGGVEIRRVGLELGPAGIDELEGMEDAGLAPERTDGDLVGRKEAAQKRVGHTQHLGLPQQIRREIVPDGLRLAPGGDPPGPKVAQPSLEGHNLLDVGEKPGVDLGEPPAILDRPAALKRLGDVPYPLPVGGGEPACDLLVGGRAHTPVEGQ